MVFFAVRFIYFVIHLSYTILPVARGGVTSYNLLYVGRKSPELKPVILMAHQDVVPIDSRHFYDLSKDIIKFSPMIDPIGFHSIDERVGLEKL